MASVETAPSGLRLADAVGRENGARAVAQEEDRVARLERQGSHGDQPDHRVDLVTEARVGVARRASDRRQVRRAPGRLGLRQARVAILDRGGSVGPRDDRDARAGLRLVGPREEVHRAVPPVHVRQQGIEGAVRGAAGVAARVVAADLQRRVEHDAVGREGDVPGRGPCAAVGVEIVGAPELVGALGAPRPRVRVAVQAKRPRVRLPPGPSDRGSRAGCPGRSARARTPRSRRADRATTRRGRRRAPRRRRARRRSADRSAPRRAARTTRRPRPAALARRRAIARRATSPPPRAGAPRPR